MGSGESEAATVALEAPTQTDAEAAVRGAIPAIEAYYADNGTYTGMTPDLLRERYDFGLGDVHLAVRSGGARYCVEAPSGATWAHSKGPEGPVSPGPC